jgi:hypothetical protein
MPPSVQALASLLVLALTCASAAAEMTVDPRSSLTATYPQLATAAGATRYFRSADFGDLDHSLLISRAEFDACLSRLEPIARPTPAAGCIEIVTISAHEFFVFLRFPEQLWQPSGGALVYRVTPRTIEAVITWDNHGTLTPGPDVTRWSYDYDASGRILRTSEWCDLINQGPAQELYTQQSSGVWSAGLMSRLLLPPPRHEIFFRRGSVSETLPASWANACSLRGITIHSPRAVASADARGGETLPTSP